MTSLELSVNNYVIIEKYETSGVVCVRKIYSVSPSE